MTLRNSLFAVSGKASFLDARRDMSGLFVCDKTTMMPIAGILDRSQDNLVTGRSDSMSVTVHPFNAVLNRYGALLIQNDGDVKVPLSAAPSANSRIDVVYVKQNETRSPMSDGSDVPEFGVVNGVAAATPVAPSVPDGALALAQVLLPAGVSNTAAAGVVITQTYIGAAMKGDMLRVQTSAQRDALTGVPEGTLLHNVADGCDYVRRDNAWMPYSGQTIKIGIPFFGGNFLTLRMSNGVVYATGSGGPGRGVNESNMYNKKGSETVPFGWRPKNSTTIDGLNHTDLPPYACVVAPNGDMHVFGSCRDGVHMNASGSWPTI
jgi:hypothetical protein|nr:MAG TPA_asm: protein of unknown function (DUF4815) [Caudoviricetes sp.]